MKNNLRRIMIAGVASVLLLAGCTTVPRTRTLPDYVRSVYVPMFKNYSYEPGLEEKITAFTVDEFLADGRLDVAQKNKADIAIEGSIRTFDIRAKHFEDDEFPLVSSASATADVTVWETAGGKRELGTFKRIEARVDFISDPRRVIEEVDVDVKERLMRELARWIVLEVLTGKYEQ
jgi:hypothetical protein